MPGPGESNRGRRGGLPGGRENARRARMVGRDYVFYPSLIALCSGRDVIAGRCSPVSEAGAMSAASVLTPALALRQLMLFLSLLSPCVQGGVGLDTDPYLLSLLPFPIPRSHATFYRFPQNSKCKMTLFVNAGEVSSVTQHGLDYSNW